MHVTCRLHATAREAVGRKHVERDVADGTTVRELLTALDAEHDGLGPLLFDAEGRLRANVNVLVNDESVRDPDWSLSDGDTLTVAPSVAGGTR
ncbi:ubiquitin-like small modifier protein 1 [Halosegnis sp.]|uniref:ubiquitin-like small modifier protein 1 n=1 Tax=Halosegnis sp. TaxID=2864959 RepID=UPI0035D40C02